MYFFRREPANQFPNLMIRGVVPDSPERVLIDLNRLSAEQGKSYQIGARIPSPTEYYWPMDAYHKVKPGVAYPAMLFIHGANDLRVEPWLSGKMAARLQAATTSGKPVLLRINYDSGHRGGSTSQQTLELSADTLAFLLKHLK